MSVEFRVIAAPELPETTYTQMHSLLNFSMRTLLMLEKKYEIIIEVYQLLVYIICNSSRRNYTRSRGFPEGAYYDSGQLTYFIRLVIATS